MTNQEAALILSISPTTSEEKNKRCSLMNYDFKSPTQERISYIAAKISVAKHLLQGQAKKKKR